MCLRNADTLFWPPWLLLCFPRTLAFDNLAYDILNFVNCPKLPAALVVIFSISLTLFCACYGFANTSRSVDAFLVCCPWTSLRSLLLARILHRALCFRYVFPCMFPSVLALLPYAFEADLGVNMFESNDQQPAIWKHISDAFVFISFGLLRVPSIRLYIIKHRAINLEAFEALITALENKAIQVRCTQVSRFANCGRML